MGVKAQTPVDAGVAEDRGALARMVMKLLDHWQLSTEDQAALLGLATSNRAALGRYRRGEAIGGSRDQFERVGHLLGIHKSLRLLFPQNLDLAYRWMTTRNLNARVTPWCRVTARTAWSVRSICWASCRWSPP